MKIQKVNQETIAIDEGFTVTSWSDVRGDTPNAKQGEGHGYIRLVGDNIQGELLLSTYRGLRILVDAIDRLYCKSIADNHVPFVSRCRLPLGHEGDHCNNESDHVGHTWSDSDKVLRTEGVN